jgi:hypothetical protein
MTVKEIKNYVDVMEHTLRRRMDSQAGKEELIKKYTEKMEQGLNAIEELEEINEMFDMLEDVNPTYDELLKKYSRVLKELEAIKSADGGEAMEALKYVGEHFVCYLYGNPPIDLKNDPNFDTIKNYILKSQSIKEDRDYWKNEYNFLFPLYSDMNAKNFKLEKELAKLKEKVSRYITLKNRLYMAQNEAMSKLEFDEYVKLEKTLQRK